MLQVASGLGLALALASPMPAQELEGNWRGTAVLDGRAVEVQLAFGQVAGRTVGTVSLTGLNGDHELFIVHYDDPILHVETPADQARVLFDAERFGNRMRGWIERDGERAPVELSRRME